MFVSYLTSSQSPDQRNSLLLGYTAFSEPAPRQALLVVASYHFLPLPAPWASPLHIKVTQEQCQWQLSSALELTKCLHVRYLNARCQRLWEITTEPVPQL